MVCVRRAVDEIEEMTETLRLYFSEGLHKNMFHKDFQMQIKGIDVLLNDGMTCTDACISVSLSNSKREDNARVSLSTSRGMCGRRSIQVQG